MRMSQLLELRNGKLICIEFPNYKPPSTGGPPFGLPAKVYLHLNLPGEKLPYDDEGNLLEEKVNEKFSEGGLKREEHFRPERSHKIGIDKNGKVMDMVSVWVHVVPDSGDGPPVLT
jgi:methyl halide transferase